MGCGSSATITKDVIRYYCYTNEEIEEINSIITKTKDSPEFKDEQIIFDKFTTEITNSIEIIRKEYITIYTHKDTYPFNGSYKYTSPKFNTYCEINLIDVKINNTKINDYKYTKDSYNFIVDIPYTLKKKDNPYITFEISYSYTDLYCYTYIEIPFKYDKENLFSFKITSEKFKFNQILGNYNEKNNLQKLSNEVILSGKEKEENDIKFVFIDNNGISLDNFNNCNDIAFYYMSNDDKRKIEDGINSCKFGFPNIVAIRDEFIFDDDRVNYKTYLTIFNYRDNLSTIGVIFDYYFRTFPDLKINTFKVLNEDKEIQLWDSGKNKQLIVSFCFNTGQYFGTMELEYSFKVEYTDNDYLCIPIKDHNLLEGCYYQLYIKKTDKDRKLNFYRDDIETKSDDPEYDYIIRTYYKNYNDDYEYNYLYYYKAEK